MALDLTNLSPEARAAFIDDGARFSSEDTLEQAHQTLNAYAIHGLKLNDYGFGADDAQELQDARDALIAAGVGREAKRTSKKIDTAALAAAMRDAQGTRLRARAILQGTKRFLLVAGKIETMQEIQALLERDSEAGHDAEPLAKQLDAMRAILNDSIIAAPAKNRGGEKVVLDLEAHAQALRDAATVKAEPRGTPVETETLDLLDGIVVSLARLARESAESAARDLAEPAMAAAFELSAIYKRKTKKKGDDAPAMPPATPEAAPEATPEATPEANGTTGG